MSTSHAPASAAQGTSSVSARTYTPGSRYARTNGRVQGARGATLITTAIAITKVITIVTSGTNIAVGYRCRGSACSGVACVTGSASVTILVCADGAW